MLPDSPRLCSILRALTARCDVPRRVLELGCGERPEGAQWFIEQYPQVGYIGLDRDRAALHRAQIALGKLDRLHLLCADCRHIPLGGKFDLLLIRHPDVDRNRAAWHTAIQQAHLWLEYEGCLLITTFHAPEAEQVREWLRDGPLKPFSMPARELIPAAIDGLDRFVLYYR